VVFVHPPVPSPAPSPDAQGSAVAGGGNSSTEIRAAMNNSGTYNISEGGGVNPMDVYINFTNVSTFNELVIREYYLGSSSHIIQVNIWDYEDSVWEPYFEFVGQTDFNVISLPVFDPSSHINNSIVQVQLHHIQNGISSHRLYIDFAWLISGIPISGTPDLTDYAKYNFNFNNFNGSGDFNTTGKINGVINYSNLINVPSSSFTNSSVQCSGTDKLMNVSLNSSGKIQGICATDQTGGGATFSSYTKFAYNGILEDDQCGVQTTTGEAWYGTAIASGTTTTSTGYRTHPCVRALRSSTTATSGYALNIGPANILLNGSESTDIIFMKPAISGNYTNASLGFLDSVSATISVDGVYLEIFNRTARAIVRANNVQYNTSNSFNIVFGDWYRVHIDVINGTQANFYLFNSTTTAGIGNTNLLWYDNVSGVLPVADSRQTGQGVIAWKIGGTTAQDILFLDYMNVNINKTLNR